MKAKIALSCTVAFSLLLTSPTSADFGEFGFELDHHSNTYFELCSSPAGFPGITNGNFVDPFSPSFPSQAAQSRAAMADASWMWVREGVWDSNISLSAACRSAPETPAGGWFDGSEEVFESWYENRSVVQSLCDNPNAIACTDFDFAFPSFYWVIAADTVLANNFSFWNTVNQDTIDDYLEVQVDSIEQTWLHEIGHQYGLTHTSSVMSTMERQSGFHRNMNLTQANNESPWPADMQQMRTRYELPGTHVNLSASAWSRDPSTTNEGRDEPATAFVTSAGSITVTVHYSLEKFFDGTIPSVAVKFFVVPINANPTFSWSTLHWTFPAGGPTWAIDTSPTIGESTIRRTFSFAVAGSTLNVGTHRVWIMVDPGYGWAETDEGDNAIPTGILIQRT